MRLSNPRRRCLAAMCAALPLILCGCTADPNVSSLDILNTALLAIAAAGAVVLIKNV